MMEKKFVESEVGLANFYEATGLPRGLNILKNGSYVGLFLDRF